MYSIQFPSANRAPALFIQQNGKGDPRLLGKPPPANIPFRAEHRLSRTSRGVKGCGQEKKTTLVEKPATQSEREVELE